ncbi:MAG: efflux RND transporter periplasmic adaptor subunit, partial [Sporomusa sp.]
VQANEALVRQAQDNINDTTVVSPINGRIDIKDLSIGNYAQAGTTVLANISSLDPVHVKFSMSETNYLQYISQMGSDATNAAGYSLPLNLTLSDGSTYPFQGQVVQVDKGLSGTTGTLTVKAEFPNPQNMLVPGMFARVVVVGQIKTGALLVPQRAIQEILGKSFITVVGEGEKAEVRAVKLGTKSGGFQIVEEGLNASDRVVVEGLTKIKQGSPVQVTMMQPDEITAPAAK